MHVSLVCKIYDHITVCKLLRCDDTWLVFAKYLFYTIWGQVCFRQYCLTCWKIVLAHSGDISKANSAVTANAENPFITLKRLFSPVGRSTRRLFCIQVSVFGTVFNILEHRADNVSVQYWIYLIPPDWVVRHI